MKGFIKHNWNIIPHNITVQFSWYWIDILYNYPNLPARPDFFVLIIDATDIYVLRYILVIQLVLNHFFPLFLKLTRKSFFFSNLKYFHFFLRERSLKTKLLSYKLNKYSWLLSILTKFSVAKSFYWSIIIKISFDSYNGIYSLRNDQNCV